MLNKLIGNPRSMDTKIEDVDGIDIAYLDFIKAFDLVSYKHLIKGVS